jgi:hypothetical protein
MGLLSKLEVLPEGIVGIIAEKTQGTRFQYQLPFYSLKSKKHIRLELEKISAKPVAVTIQLNGTLLFQDRFQETKTQRFIRVPSKKHLQAKGNLLEIKSSEEIRIKNFSMCPKKEPF